MNRRFIISEDIQSPKRVISKSISNEVFAEFYVRLYSYFESSASEIYEGYEFQIFDTKTGVEFSAALTGFGAGYFAKNEDPKTIEVIHEFDNEIYSKSLPLKNCTYEYEHDYGKSIIQCINEKIVYKELDE